MAKYIPFIAISTPFLNSKFISYSTVIVNSLLKNKGVAEVLGVLPNTLLGFLITHAYTNTPKSVHFSRFKMVVAEKYLLVHPCTN